jgi:RimJ/RimL family protein N-acetyltransferase
VAFFEQSALGWRDRTSATFAGVDPDDDDEILLSAGLVRIDPHDLVAEIGYWTAPQHRRQGFTAAAAEMLSRTALTLWGFIRIELMADVANRASQRVAVSAGFRSEGIARCSLFLDGRHHDAVVFSRVRRDL